MPDQRIIESLACFAAGLLLAGAAEVGIKRWPRQLGIARGIAGTFFICTGMYIASLVTATHYRIGTVPFSRAYVGILIVLATIVIARFTRRFINSYSHHATGSVIAVSVFENVAGILVMIVGFLVVLDFLGISITPILTAFGVGGLAVALALQDTLANLFAGIEIAASRQLHVGDYVRLDNGDRGAVVDITWRNTVVEDVDGNRVIVPNAKLAAAIFMRYTMPMRVDVPLTIEKKQALKVAEFARDAAAQVQDKVGTTHGEASIRFDNAPDVNMLEMIVSFHARKPADQRAIQAEFTRAFLENSAKAKEVGES